MKKSVIIGSIIGIVVILAIVLVFFVLPNEYISGEDTESTSDQFSEQSEGTSEGDCTEEEKKFNYPPVNLEKTELAVPLGLMSGGHVTPIDHMYFQDFDNDEANIEVYSPADGKITEIQYMFGSRIDSDQNEIPWEDFRLDIEHACGLSSLFIHIDVLSDKVSAFAPEKGEFVSVEIPVVAGEVIGWYSDNVDYNLVDQEVILPGLLVAEHYENEEWKIHTPSDQYSYFNDDIKSKLIEKSLRHEEPYSGKFDWDRDGTLQGNWFVEGSGGYKGIEGEQYWASHLSFSPNYLDYDHFIVSMGDYGGQTEQFGAIGNSPKPEEVTVSSGIITYELTTYDFYTQSGDRWDRKSLTIIDEVRNNDFVLGTVLVEMIEDRKIKFEAFPGKTKEQVSGFTDNAEIYVR